MSRNTHPSARPRALASTIHQAPDGYLVESRRDLGEHAIDDAFLIEHVDDEAYEAAEAVNRLFAVEGVGAV